MRSFEEEPCDGELQLQDDENPNIINLQEQEEQEEEDNPLIISQHLLELSSMLPGLPDQGGMIDEATILKRTIEQLEKHQRDQANLLHELATRSSAHDNTVPITCVCGSSSGGLDNGGDDDCVPPNVKVMSNGKNLLTRIYCKQTKGILPRIAEEIDKFHLSIVNMCSIPCGDLADITIVASISHGFIVEAKDLETALQKLLTN